MFLIAEDREVEVVEVPPQMTAQARRQQRTRSKSDYIDALAIARIAARKGTTCRFLDPKTL